MNNYGISESSGQILSNSLYQFWNNKLIPLQILYLSSVLWKIIPLYFFSSKNIHFAQKEHHENEMFWDFPVLRSNFVKLLMPILKWQVDSSPNLVSLFSFMKDYSYLFFLAQRIYTLLKMSPLKWTFLRFSSPQVKICEIPYANLKQAVDFSPNFVSLFTCMKDYSSVLS